MLHVIPREGRHLGRAEESRWADIKIEIAGPAGGATLGITVQCRRPGARDPVKWTAETVKGTYGGDHSAERVVVEASDSAIDVRGRCSLSVEPRKLRVRGHISRPLHTEVRSGGF